MSTGSKAAPANSRSGTRSALQNPGLQQGLGLLGMLVLVIVVMAILSPYFFRLDNVLNLLLAISTIGLIAMVTTMLMVGGGLDLSVGSVVALVGVVISSTQGTLGVWGAVAAGIAVGLIIGLANGLLVTRVGINPLITTLGMLSMARGLAFVLSGGLTQPVLDPTFGQLGQGFVGVVPIPVIALAIVTIACYITMRFTTYGRAMYAIGGNAQASYLAGLPVKRYQLIAYVLSGLSAAVASVFLTAQLAAGAPQAATGLELSVVAAVVLGGTSLAGGQGNILGTIVGVLILGTLNNGMVLLSISSYYQQVAQGLVLLLAVGLDQFRIGSLVRPSARRGFRLGFANVSEDLPFAAEVRRGLEEAAAQAGDFGLLLLDNSRNTQQAQSNAERFIAEKMDLVIENQLDDITGSQLMAGYRAAGVPVIVVDNPVPGAVYFGANNFQAGRTAGEALGNWIGQHWGGEVSGVIALEQPEAGKGVRARADGLREGLLACLAQLPAGCTWTVDCDSDRSTIERRVADLLRQHAGRIAVTAVDDDAALAATAAARSLGRTAEIAVVGQGGLRAAREELRHADTPLVGTVMYAPERYGETLLQTARRLLAGGNVPPEIYVEHVFLTPENVSQYYLE